MTKEKLLIGQNHPIASEFGISFDDREKLVNCISRRDIKEGELIRSDDIYSSYGEKKIF